MTLFRSVLRSLLYRAHERSISYTSIFLFFSHRSIGDELLLQYVLNTASFLLLLPGHPKRGPFYLAAQLQAKVEQYVPWATGKGVGRWCECFCHVYLCSLLCCSLGSAIALLTFSCVFCTRRTQILPSICTFIHPTVFKTRALLGVLRLLLAYAQPKFALRIDGVQSNDTLYGSEASYLDALQESIDACVETLLAQLAALGASSTGDGGGGGGVGANKVPKKVQGELALDLATIFVDGVRLDKKSATLVVKLFSLAKGADVAKSSLRGLVAHLHSRKGVWYSDLAAKLASVV
jgi:hypothetical protein